MYIFSSNVTKTIPLFILLILSNVLMLQAETARIKDKDGFTNVRSGKGTQYPVIATLDTSDLFFCDRSNDEWIKIIILTKFTDISNVEGYIHKSSIEFLEDIDINSKKELLEKTLNTYQKKLKHCYNLRQTKEYDKTNTVCWEASGYSDRYYSPILEILPSYLLLSNDTNVLQLFYATIWEDKGSANETPAIIVATCYMNQPDFIIDQTLLLDNKELRSMILNDIEHGLDIHSDHYNELELKKANRLVDQLNTVREHSDNYP